MTPTVRRGSVFPLAPSQEGLAFDVAAAADGSDVYCNQTVLELEGGCDPEVLERAWAQIVARHEALRLVLVRTPDGLAQQVQEQVPTAVDVLDLRATEAPAGETATAWCDQLRRDLRGLGRAPLVGLAIVLLQAERWWLVINHHHLVLDGWSTALVLAELLRAAQEPGALTLTPPPSWARTARTIRSLESDPARSAWADELAEVPEASYLVADTPEKFDHDTVTLDLGREIMEALRDGALAMGTTPATVVQCAWGVTLGALLGRNDVVYGATVSGRTAPVDGITDVVGPLATTLPRRLSWGPRTTGAELLADADRRYAELDAQAHLPLHEILVLGGSNARFDTAVVYENYPSPGDTPGAPQVIDVRATNRSSLPLTLVVTPGETLHVVLEHSVAGLQAEAVVQIGQRFASVLRHLVTRPHDAVISAELCTPEEHQRGAAQLQAQPVDEPATGWELVAAAVRSGPGRPALEDDDGTWSYAELAETAAAAACALEARGCRPGATVALVHRARRTTIAALLGAWRMGANVVPLDPGLPAGRLRRVVAAAVPDLVIADTVDDPVLAEIGIEPSLVVETAHTSVNNLESASLPTDTMLVDSPAYTLFTSGSTGAPKGVMVTHRGLADLAATQRRSFALAPGARVLQFAAPSFDGMVAETVATLAAGATLILRSDRYARMPGDDLARTLTDAAVTHLTLPPSSLPLMPPGSLDRLDCLVVAGEAAEPAHLAHVPEHVRIVNAYGPTEATVCATISAPVTDRGSHVPIGTVIDGVRAYVLDPNLRPVLPGAPGELYLAGGHLALGYLGQAGETAARFVADPIAADGSRCYRTGDVVTWGARDGLRYVGRADDQVQVRGQRVEPGEVEAALGRLPEIQQAVIVVCEEELIAFVVPDDGSDVHPDVVREHAAAVLPAAMIPARIILRDRLPRTQAGKIDRIALREDAAAGPTASGLVGRPAGSHERVLCELFGEVLGSPCGPDDDFFTRGGHSLLAVQLVARVNAVLGTALPVRDVFEAPTPAQLARCIDTTDQTQHPVGAVAPRRPTHIPLSPAQERLWFLHRLEGGTSYHLSFLIQLPEPTDPKSATQAVRDVIARHDAARTTVRESTDGSVTLQVLDPHQVPPVGEVRCAPDTVAEQARVLADEPFDLATVPPFRAAVAVEDGHDAGEPRAAHSILLVLHHIGFDAESIAVLAADLGHACRARLRGGAPTWEPLGWQWPDVVAHQQRELAQERDDLEWWRENLRGASGSLSLPFRAGRRSTDPAGPVRTVELPLDETVADGISRVARRCSVTPFMVLHAGVVATLSRFGAGDDVVVGTNVTTRNRAEWSGVAGLFLDTVLLRLCTAPDQRFGDLVMGARQADTAAFVRHVVPYEQVVRMLDDDATGPARGIDVTVDLATGPMSSVPAEAEVEVVASTSARARFPLSFGFWVDGDGRLQGAIHHDTDLFDPDVVDQLARSVVHLLAAAVRDPRATVGALPLLDEATSERYLSAGAGTELAHSRPVGELFRRAANEHAARVAVVSDGEEVTYAQLAAWVDATVEMLRRRGVGPTGTVAFELPTSREAVVVMLATLRLGACYVPVDPEWPEARRATVLAAARPDVVLGAEDLAATSSTTGAYPGRAETPTGEQTAGPVDPRQAAYILFTSGSTGEPKAVTVEHRALEAYVAWALNAYPEAAGTTLLHTRPTFDLSITTQLVPFLAGGTVHITDLATESWDSAPQPDFTKVTPSHLALMDVLPDAASPTGRLVVGGEQLTGAMLGRIRQRFPHVTVTNDYGPTETTVNCVEYVINPGDPLAPGAVPIGRPVPGNSVAVLDARLRPVPVGVDGELYVWGDGLARGYGRAGLTATRFIANPYGPAGSRMYRTGDVARWEPGGTLRMTGRSDRQVKVRGHRLELDEVEAVARAHPGVRGVVALMGGQGNEARLSVVVAADESFSIDALQERFQRHLPSGACPDVVARVGSLPLTPHGKTDQAAVQELVTGTVPSSVGHPTGQAAPATEAEERVCDVFAQVLSTPRFGTHDDFFAHGGHSLLALVLARRLTEALGETVPLATVLSASTPRALLDALQRSPGNRARATARRDVDWEPAVVATPRTGRPHRVLLTGATGFLGGHVLDALLPAGYEVLCLVRATNNEAALERLRGAATARGTDPGSWPAGKVQAVAAHLDQPRLGLTEAALGDLAEGLDAVVHSAADSTSTKPYESLRASNLLATRTLLELAASCGAAFHYVSTSSVVPPPPQGEGSGDCVSEDFLTDVDNLEANGYVLTKWAAEATVRRAGAAGLVTRIYRPSRIITHSETGQLPGGDAFARVLEAVVRVGAVPDEGVERGDLLHSDLVCVDAVAEVIAAEVGRAGRADRELYAAFHLTAARPMSVTTVLAAVREIGISLEPVPMQEWRSRLKELASEDPRMDPDLVLAGGWPVSQRPVRLARTTLETHHPTSLLVRRDVDGEVLRRAISALSTPDTDNEPNR